MIKILAIDDNSDNLISLKAVINDAFPDSIVFTALNGLKGIELAIDKDPDVILLDIVMPDMDGFEVCLHLKQVERVCDIPVVFVTALKGDKNSRIKALEVGAEAFLTKPIDETELTAQIRAMVKIKAANEQKRTDKERLALLVDERTRELEHGHIATLKLVEELRTENEARRKTEDELQESETHFRNLADLGQALIWTSGIDKKCNYFNQPWLNFTGQTLEHELGDGWVDGVHPDDLQHCVDIYVNAFDRREKFSMEYRVRHVSGEYRWIQDDGTPRYNSKGEFIGFIGHCLDITNRVQAVELIKLEEARLESLFKINQHPAESIQGLLDFALEEAISLTGSKIGYIYFYNEIKKEFTLNTWSKEVMQQCTVTEPQTIYELDKTGVWGEAVRQVKPIVINDFAAINPLKKGIPEGHAPLHKFLTVPVFSGVHIVAVVGVANKLDDYNNSDIRQLNLMMDAIWKIVQRKQAEVALKESEARLLELNATKDKFFSIIAHDLKSPFNSIAGFSDLLVEQVREKNYEGIEEYAAIIQDSSQRVMDLLINLLEWSRSQIGRMQYNPEFVELVGLINQVCDLMNETAHQKSITLDLKIPRTAPVIADKAMISTVLRNLLSNAVKFTNPGGTITISIVQKPQELLISFADNGIGIRKEQIDKLFRIDQSYSTTGTHNEKGTGLGLILCKEFVEKHGGKIWVESDPDGISGGKGSKFCFTIPKI